MNPPTNALGLDPRALPSDDACRMSAEVNLHYHATLTPVGWVAIRLEDGGSDHQLYDTRAQAIRHQGARSEDVLYLKLLPGGGMTPPVAERLLRFNRRVRAAGGKMADPEMMHGIPIRLEHLR